MIAVVNQVAFGDRASFTLNGHSTLLPDAYYLAAADKLRRRFDDPFFVIVGDDPDHAESLFGDLPRKFVSRLSIPEDLALMSLCSGGVLSNSTFVWWGAFLGEPGGIYLAPRYWSGFAWGEWSPSGMNTALVTEYLDVPSCESSGSGV